MKAVEVINLLSSPETVIRKPKTISNATSSITASALSFGKPPAWSTFQAGRTNGGKETEEWFCISDDRDHDDHLTTPIVHEPVRHDDHMGNPPSRNLNSTSAWNRTAPTASGLKRISSGGKYSRNGNDKDKTKGKEDVFFLSDNTDTTIDLSDPFGSVLEPAAKRRRVSPEPDFMKNTYSAIQKGKGIARSVSDVTATSRSATMSTVNAPRLKRSKTSVQDDDPILFSSSPDIFSVARNRKEKVNCSKEQDFDEDNNDLFQTYGPSKMASATTRRVHEEGSHPSSSDLDLPDIATITSRPSSFPFSSRVDSKKTLTAYRSEKVALQKQRDKVRKVQEKLELKEAEKERKRATKEAKAKEKEMAADLAKVNTLRIDKKVSTPAMIVDLPRDLDARLAAQVRQFLGPLEVECKEWNNPIPSIIKWRRKVDSIYNEDAGFWEPIPLEIKPEKHVMCVMPAKEFVDLTMADEGRDLDAHILRIKARFDRCAIIYLVEGLTPWMRKNRNIKNRQYTEAVRSQMAQGLEERAASASQKGKKKTQQEYVDEDMIEDSLLRLQVIHGAQIHHTTATVDTAQWVMVFTQHISTIPYR